MRIQSKKTGAFFDISKEEWGRMRKRHAHLKYDVIDEKDAKSEPVEIKVEEIVRFTADEPEEFEETEQDKYRRLLDELGEKYHHMSGVDKLKKQYEEATQKEDERD